MIGIAQKYYLRFPPMARKAINFSIAGFMNSIGVDYYHSDTENILIGCTMINKNIFA